MFSSYIESHKIKITAYNSDEIIKINLLILYELFIRQEVYVIAH